MRLTFWYLFLFVLLIWLNTAQALEQEGKFWSQISTEGKVTEDRKWTYFSDLEFRYHFNHFRLDAVLPEAGVGYHFTRQSSLWAGLQMQLNSTDTNKNNYYNYFQQFLWHTSLNHFVKKISIRSRLEERANTASSGINLLLRERLNLLFSKPSRFPTLKPVFYDELFITLRRTDWAHSGTIPQNRLYLGFNFPIGKKATMDLGYLNQYFPADRGNAALMNHILFLGLNL